jgi:hypothetical protein
MAEVGISEFSFGYAFLFEQTQANWGNLKAAPILPNLKQEAYVGWDAQLPLKGTDFYYQFKLTDYLWHGNAEYLADGTYTSAYYRFRLNRRNGSEQHRRLKRLSVSNPQTYYVTPEFNSMDEFNASFLAQQISAKCRIIPLSQCLDVTDGDQHCITFQPGDPAWEFHSERSRREHSYRGEEIGTLYRGSQSRWQPINVEFAEGLLERTRAIAREVTAEEGRQTPSIIDEKLTDQNRTHLLIRAAEILSVTLGVTMVLVGSRE